MIRRLTRWIARLSLQIKIFAIAMLCSLTVLAGGAYVGLPAIRRAHEAQLSQSLAGTLQASQAGIRQTLDGMGTLSNVIFADDLVQAQMAVVASSPDALTRANAYRRLYDILQSFEWEYSNGRIHFIALYGDGFAAISNAFFAGDVPPAVTQALYDEAMAADGALTYNTDYTQQYGLFVTRSVREIDRFSLRPLGVLMLCLDMDRIVRDATTFASAYGQTLFLIERAGATIYQSPGMADGLFEQASAQLGGEPYGVLRLGGERFFAIGGALGTYDMDYICMVSYERTYAQMRSAYTVFWAALLISAAIATLLSLLMSHAISRHFSALVQKMRSFRGEPLPPGTGDEDYSERTDEVGLLHQQFDSMAGEIAGLIQERYLADLLTKDAQIQALQAQINPHFLYNVLDSVNWRAQKAGIKEISTMMEALGRLMRVTLDRDTKLIPLRDELALVGYYITIQQLRFEDQMAFESQVDASLLPMAIPKLVIQPLVENAVRHAVEMSVDGVCTITLAARREGDDLLITVSNTGSQFANNLLEKLRGDRAVAQGFGIGLLNIDGRLRLTFGDAYGLTVGNAGACAVAQVRIPCRPAQTVCASTTHGEEAPDAEDDHR